MAGCVKVQNDLKIAPLKNEKAQKLVFRNKIKL